jgi:hypothetical protein
MQWQNEGHCGAAIAALSANEVLQTRLAAKGACKAFAQIVRCGECRLDRG